MPRSAVDYRIGGVPVWRAVPDDWEGFLRLPDEVLQSVVFLGRKEMDPKINLEKEVLGGTAFFVALPVGFGAHLFCLVTARHVAQQIEDGQFFIRINTKDGTARNVWLDGGVTAKWIYHETDDTLDAAVLLWMPPDDAVFLGIPEAMFLPQKHLERKRIGIGDEVFVTGLFSFHTGRQSNEPIVRNGHIAMMPKERVPVPDWHKEGIEAYLIEGRSIGGFSGSPVFVRRSIQVQPTEETGQKPLAAGAIFWLGLMHGHWKASSDDVDAILPTIASSDPETAINAGISIVVPCYKILELLHHPIIREAARRGVDLLEERHSAILDGTSPNRVKRGKEREASRAVTLVATASAPQSTISEAFVNRSAKTDSAFSFRKKQKPKRATSTEPESDNPAHKEDFMSLLNEAAKTPPQDD
jgi:hypothetical protein